MVDRREMIGGMSLHTGTIPSKTLREAVLYLTGYRQRAFYSRRPIVESRQQAHNRGLPCSGRPDERGQLTVRASRRHH